MKKQSRCMEKLLSYGKKKALKCVHFNLSIYLTDVITMTLSVSQGQMILPGCIQFKECYRSSKLLSQKLYSLLFKMLST